MKIAVIGSRTVAEIDFDAIGAQAGDVIVSGGARGVIRLRWRRPGGAGLPLSSLGQIMPDLDVARRLSVIGRSWRLATDLSPFGTA